MGWNGTAAGASEAAALLVIDNIGAGKIVCLPTRAQAKISLPEIHVRRLLDVAWKQGLVVAGRAGEDTDDELLLVAPGAKPRILARGVRSARLSPDATALAYEVETSADDDLGSRRSYVLELRTGKLVELGTWLDPLWESDGQHLRATELRRGGKGAQGGHSSAVRIRWSRESGTVTVEGPGSAQIPAAAGSAVAWTQERPTSTPPPQCSVFLRPRGGVRHAVVGRFCAGIADDREVRWSRDGRWLAFPHPEQGQDPRGRMFVDVVSPDGGRSPALSELAARARPGTLTFPHGPTMWFDWSPSGRFLAFDAGLAELRVFDFEARALTSLGKGAKPTFSPDGTYLLVVDGETATVLLGPSSANRVDLGAVRDARWLPAAACGPHG